MSTHSPVGAVFLDLDDTLIVTSGKYREVRTRAYDFICDKLGLDWGPDTWDESMDAVEALMKLTHGFEKQRFPLSLVELYKVAARAQGVPIDYHHAHQVEAFGWSVYNCQHRLIPGALAALCQLLDRGFRLVLLTKGDLDVQTRKIQHAGLRDYFDEVVVVRDKSPGVYEAQLRRLGLDPKACFMVGDSTMSDINPAMAAGMNAIYIEQPDAWVLEVEPLMAEPIRLASIRDLPAFLQAYTPALNRNAA